MERRGGGGGRSGWGQQKKKKRGVFFCLVGFFLFLLFFFWGGGGGGGGVLFGGHAPPHRHSKVARIGERVGLGDRPSPKTESEFIFRGHICFSNPMGDVNPARVIRGGQFG